MLILFEFATSHFRIFKQKVAPVDTISIWRVIVIAMPKTQRLGGEELKKLGLFFLFFIIYTNLLMFIFMDLLTHVYTYDKKNYIEKKVENFLKFFFLHIFIFGVQVLKILHNLLEINL